MYQAQEKDTGLDINEKIRGNYPEGWLSSSRSSKAHQGHKPVFAVFAYYDFQQIGPDFLNDFRLEEQAECGGAMNLSKAMDYD